MASVLDENMVRAKITDLKPYPQNPRKGNIDLIAESLKENGQFRPLIVQKSTGYVLGGNHTLYAAKKLKWKTIQVVYVDVDDDRAKRIVLADNRTSDLATYDSDILMEIINSLDQPDVGTGYDGAAIQNILTAVVERDAELLSEVINDKPKITFADDDLDITFDDRMARSQTALTESPLIEDQELKDVLLGNDPNAVALMEGRQRVHTEVQVAVEKLIETLLPSSNYWGVPDLRMDMLVDALPRPFDTWADQKTTPDDGKTTWFFQWGTSNGTDFPWERGCLGFFSHDAKWDSWYVNTAYLIGKVVSLGCRMAASPDNSVTLGFPRYSHLKANFEGQWLSRLMQEVGIKIIPNLRFTDPESAKYAVLGIPKGAPVIMTGVQAISEQDAIDLNVHGTLRQIVKELEPQQVIVYGGPPAERCLERAKLPKGVEGIYVENFSAKRNKALEPWHEQRRAHDAEVKKARARAKAGAGEEASPEE